MSVRRSSIIWLVLGVILIAAALIIRFVALPTLSKLPSDLNQSQDFEGTLTAVDPAAFAAGDLANLFTPEMPITAVRGVSVDATDGDTAIVTSSAVITLPDGTEQKDVHSYAVSRIDYSPVELTADQIRDLVPSQDQATFEPHQGVAFSLPMDPPRDGISLYDSVTRTAQPAAFVDSGSVDGRDVNNYRVDAQGAIASPAVLEQFSAFPSQLPKQLVAGLLQAGVVPEASREQVSDGLAELGDLVDIGFGSTNSVELAADQQFGAPIEIDQVQGMYVTVPIDGQQVPVLPLSVIQIRSTDGAVSDLASTLSDNSRLLSILGRWIPGLLGVLGVGLVLTAVLRWKGPLSESEAVQRVHTRV